METKEKQPKNTQCSNLFLISQILLRLLATIFAMASIFILRFSNEDIYLGSEAFGYLLVGKARYSYSSALRYMLVVDAGVCVFSILSTILVLKAVKFSKNGPDHDFYFYLLIFDEVMMILAISGCASATAIGMVALKGLNKPGISWAPVCPFAHKFCSKITLSIITSYASFACLITLTLIVACKLKSRMQ
ncbi:hypothetical protein OSB04_022787 [Centaurea solstitialis]|uniref:CASP-like protein n=1 Tax=Centaurea solstitialis TaxID=347529 RepID=A0AA38W8T3_9ASTR|nr:hypothetical protein OSB04_022787 [Centaurea solstitialis]